MEFIKVMEIKARYLKWLCMDCNGKPAPEWYWLAFETKSPKVSNLETAERNLLTWAEQHPEKPAHEQVKVMRALVELGFKWVAKDVCGEIHAFENYPEKGVLVWASAKYKEGWARTSTLNCLLPLVKDWRTPLDLLAALRDAGEGVE